MYEYGFFLGTFSYIVVVGSKCLFSFTTSDDGIVFHQIFNNDGIISANVNEFFAYMNNQPLIIGIVKYYPETLFLHIFMLIFFRPEMGKKGRLKNIWKLSRFLLKIPKCQTRCEVVKSNWKCCKSYEKFIKNAWNVVEKFNVSQKLLKM